MHHIAVAIPGGFAVAYQRPTGELCAVSDHGTKATAEKEAQNLNAQRAARAAHHRHHAFAEPRPLRWFEPDAFA